MYFFILRPTVFNIYLDIFPVSYIYDIQRTVAFSPQKKLPVSSTEIDPENMVAACD